ncbi:MAG: OmpH family outer membrane protein [Bacteroidales bacterium]|nr:OmpH family outer membrane protein [Bacteroidales bacterium]
MKNNKISLLISILALVGVIVLLIGQFSNKEKSNTTPNVEPKETQIVYVNIDSVLISYDLYNALSLQLMQKQQQLESELQTKMLSLQNRMTQLQNKFNQALITSANYQQQAEALTNEQYTLQSWQEQKALELNEDQVGLTQRVYDSIVSVVNYINADKKYDLIISSSLGGTLLYGNPDWDITDQVVTLLNQRASATAVADSNTVTN